MNSDLRVEKQRPGQPLTSIKHNSDTVLNAYNICKSVQDRILRGRDWEKLPEGSADYLNVMYARICGHLLVYAPTDAAVLSIATSIVSAEDCDVPDGGYVVALGQAYADFFLHAFRQQKEHTPQEFYHSPPDSPEDSSTDVEKIARAGPQNHSEAKIAALARDDHRCMWSGHMDSKRFRELVKARRRPQGYESLTECAHIFAESTNWDIEGPKADKKRNYAINAWIIIAHFGCQRLVESLQKNGIHSLHNVMTMDSTLHSYFDRLDLWLESVDGHDHMYEIVFVSSINVVGLQLRQRVQFQSHVAGAPLPDPEALRIHAACCKVVHMSGASAYYDRLEELWNSNPHASDAAFGDALLSRLDGVERGITFAVAL